jgi:threonine/homoserine/homoserine lactone efflux protein
MSFELWLAFVAASVVLLVIPGPTILSVISYSVAHGRRANVPLVAAVALGDSTALALSLLGLGALLATSAFWFTVVKWVGGLYLLYLGIKLLRAGAGPMAADAPVAPTSRWRLFLNTYAVTALNPKGMIFFVAFLPQFLRPDTPAAPQLWLLAIRCAGCPAVLAIRGLANNSASPGRAAAQPTQEPDLGHDSLDGSPCGDPQPADGCAPRRRTRSPAQAGPGPWRQGWRATWPHATTGASRQAVPGGGDLWVAEDRSTMGGAPQARFVL